jgi:Fe-S oxidoreductase
MSHSRSTSLCCGGGGGGMWLDGFQWEKAHTRTSEWRIREALSAEADILAIAPYERFEMPNGPRAEARVRRRGF